MSFLMRDSEGKKQGIRTRDFKKIRKKAWLFCENMLYYIHGSGRWFAFLYRLSSIRCLNFIYFCGCILRAVRRLKQDIFAEFREYFVMHPARRTAVETVHALDVGNSSDVWCILRAVRRLKHQHNCADFAFFLMHPARRTAVETSESWNFTNISLLDASCAPYGGWNFLQHLHSITTEARCILRAVRRLKQLFEVLNAVHQLMHPARRTAVETFVELSFGLCVLKLDASCAPYGGWNFSIEYER